MCEHGCYNDQPMLKSTNASAFDNQHRSSLVTAGPSSAAHHWGPANTSCKCCLLLTHCTWTHSLCTKSLLNVMYSLFITLCYMEWKLVYGEQYRRAIPVYMKKLQCVSKRYSSCMSWNSMIQYDYLKTSWVGSVCQGDDLDAMRSTCAMHFRYCWTQT